MALLSGPYGYSKLHSEDPEEMMHRRAQFLIYKVLKQADRPPRRPFFIMRIKLRRLKVKIGRRLKRLKKSILLSITSARVRVYKQFTSQWIRLFSRGHAIGSLPGPIFS